LFGAEVLRFEALPGSLLPAKLAELDWQVRHLGPNTPILPGAVTDTYIDHDSPGRPQVTRCHAGPVSVALLRNADAQGVTMTAGYRDFRPRDEDPNDHAAVAAMQARSEAVKADEALGSDATACARVCAEKG
jgi:hypothetical protein